MKRLLLLVLLTSSVCAKAGIDLTATPSEYVAEGLTFRQLSLKDGDRRIIFEPPPQWTFRGTSTTMQFTPPNTSRADAFIQVADAKAPERLDDNVISALREKFMATLPVGCQHAQIVNEEFNPVQFEGASSYAITGKYQAIGETFLRSTVFVNLPASQLTFRLTARQPDFEKLNKPFRGSILSWHWVGPSPRAQSPVTVSN
jgi:hypothetical protein